MTAFACQFCNQGPFDQREIIRIKTAQHEFVLCGGGNCVRKLFNQHSLLMFRATSGHCQNDDRPAVAAVSERGNRSLSVCARCLQSMFFNVAGR